MQKQTQPTPGQKEEPKQAQPQQAAAPQQNGDEMLKMFNAMSKEEIMKYIGKKRRDITDTNTIKWLEMLAQQALLMKQDLPAAARSIQVPVEQPKEVV